MKRPPLFTIMLAAFVLVIVLGVCGMAGLYSLAVANHGRADPTIVTADPEVYIKGGLEEVPYTGLALQAPGTDDHVRGFISAGLALAAVLLGVATLFSSRLSRPLGRLTHAARTMAAGDLSVRVGSSAVREVDELAQAFNAMAASIAHADQQRRQLTADVAHELRTPLSIIRGRLEGMQDGIYRDTPEQVEVLLDETALFERLIEDLRLLALADAGQLPLYPSLVCPSQLLHDVAQSFHGQAQSAGVFLQVAANGDIPEIRADPQRLAQVLENLVSNALRYTPPGGTITLHGWAAPDRQPHVVYISVSDTGAGIAPQDLPYIFDRFYRADRARSRVSGGVGLGLAIAKRIIEAHGGHIQANSAPGQGTTVAFSLLADASG